MGYLNNLQHQWKTSICRSYAAAAPKISESPASNTAIVEHLYSFPQALSVCVSRCPTGQVERFQDMSLNGRACSFELRDMSRAKIAGIQCRADRRVALRSKFDL